MTEPACGVPRLVLGFDATCAPCSRVAAAARNGSRGRLEAMALTDSQMQAWLSSAAAGRDLSDRPVLVRITPGGVTVSAGLVGPPLALVRRLGPRATLAVLRALGQTNAAAPGGAGDRSGNDRSVHRRTVLGGLVGALGLAAAAAAAGAPSSAARPAAAARRYTPMMSRPLDASETAWLRRGEAVVLAGNTFGRADWGSVQKGWSPRQNRALYTIASHHPDRGATHLVTSGPTSDDMPMAISLAAGGRADSVTLHTYSAGGAPFVSVSLGRDGVDTTSGVRRPPDIVPTTASATALPAGPSKAFIDCFLICLQGNGADDAAMPCISCLNSTSPTEAMIYCAQCYALAGDSFGQCSRECAGFM